MLQALTIWAAVIIVVISTLADLALVLIRASGRRGGRPASGAAGRTAAGEGKAATVR